MLVNNAAPNQVGSFIDVPGTLTDIIADPVRNQFFVVRSDKNEVLAFDGSNYSLIATLPTGNQPTTMAISFDQQYLLVGNGGSQIVNVYDLDTLQPVSPILLPSGFIALSIASSANATLAQGGYFDGTFHILQLDIAQGTGAELPSLGVFKNLTNANTVMTTSQNGSTIFIAQSGRDAYTSTTPVRTPLRFPARTSRRWLDRTPPQLSINMWSAAIFWTLRWFRCWQFQTGTGNPSGFAFVNQTGFRSTAPLRRSPTTAGTTTPRPPPARSEHRSGRDGTH